jgi:site-specific DNA-methyltransferase (adenine-specific)
MSVELYLGDCLEYMKTMPDKSVDAVITDPPYPNNGGHFVGDIPVAKKVLLKLKCQSIVFWSEVEKPPVYIPLVALHICTYNNVNGRSYEAMYHFHPDGRKRKSEVINYWMIKQGIGPADKEYAGHPSQKPIVVIKWLVEKYTEVGDTIFDPFMGSGTTGVACVQLGRNFIGCEIDQKYFAIAEKRIKQAQLQEPLFT